MNTILDTRSHANLELRPDSRASAPLLNRSDSLHRPITPALSHPMGEGARTAGEGHAGGHPGNSSASRDAEPSILPATGSPARAASSPRLHLRRSPARLAWLTLCLIGAMLLEGPSSRILLQAQEADDDAQPTPAVKAEVEDATEAARTLGDDSSGAPGGFHIEFNPGDGEIVRIGSSVHLHRNEKARELVIVFGDATVDGEVDGDVVVVFGDVAVDGTVRGDFVNVMGSSRLGPNARLEGECTVVGGKLEKDAGAQLHHQPVQVSFGVLFNWLKPLGYWMQTGLLLGRPLPPTSGLAWVWLGLHFVIYLIIFLLMPKPVEMCVKTLENQALPAFLVGLLAMVLVGPLIVILMASGIGLIVVPFVFLAMLAAKYVGKAAVLQFTGLQLCRRFSPEASPRSLAAFLIGSALVTLLYMVPLLGFIVYGVLLPLGLGAALMAGVAAFHPSGNVRPTAIPTTTVALSTLSSAGNPPTPDHPAPPSASSIPVASALTPALAAGSPADVAVLPRIGFWLRLGATSLDFLLFFWLIPAAGPFFLFVWFAYHLGMWTWKGTTIGGVVCGLKVVRLDGREIDFGVALVRSLGSVLSFMALGLGFFWAGWSNERQSWHDTIAGTTIVKVPKGISLV